MFLGLCTCALVPVETSGIDYSQGGTGSCELPNIDAENQTWVLCKRSVSSPVLLTTVPYLHAIKDQAGQQLLTILPRLFIIATKCTTTVTSSLLVKLYVWTLRTGLGSHWTSVPPPTVTTGNQPLSLLFTTSCSSLFFSLF